MSLEKLTNRASIVILLLAYCGFWWILFVHPRILFIGPYLPTDYYMMLIMSLAPPIMILFLLFPKKLTRWFPTACFALALSGTLALLFGQLIPQYFGILPTQSWTQVGLGVGIMVCAGLGIVLAFLISVQLRDRRRELASSIQNLTSKRKEL